ncbi:MAG: UDP-N-acetylmuramoyl-L-alanyl-D-glutamate--2,6-diaminopimelate ligase [Simkaniaceae bacterium]|nr:UDP-N-acetylmuramoyl-L-alanyl-D-glutamate--2,6-diaminopimelate ligase [Simkaniaceae bacterium]
MAILLLKKLFQGIDVEFSKGAKEGKISGVSSDSRTVLPGSLFIAKKGAAAHGINFISAAVASGATAVLTDIYNPFLQGVHQVIYSAISKIEGLIAERYYGFPSAKLFMVGITGTNGKTTTSYLIKHLLDGKGHDCGLMGTIETVIGKHQFPRTHTTSDICTNQKLLFEMVKAGCRSSVMEVSSHALDQGRVEGVEFDVAVFTNLSLDHLDYHRNMDEYANAKGKLFESLKSDAFKKKGAKLAVINMDDSFSEFFLEKAQAEAMTFGMEKNADLRAIDVEFSMKHTKFTLQYQNCRYAIKTALLGKFNVYNTLAAMAVALKAGLTLKEITQKLITFKSVPGRLEKVFVKNGAYVFVDYAHTDKALENVLKTLHELKQGKIITVFGCGGCRDLEKRPLMGSQAEKFSDFVIVTSDNPRSEDPQKICDQIILGFNDAKGYVVELDRKKAITRALSMAKKSDIILIAGKGHETYQLLSDGMTPFDDRQIVRSHYS